jgi:iron(III) transport system permease protein
VTLPAATSAPRAAPLTLGMPLLSGTLGAVAAFLIVWPTLVLGRAALGAAPALDVTSVAATLGRTLAVAASSTVLAVTLGALVAWTLARTTLPARAAASRLVRLPLVAPPFAAALALRLAVPGADGFGAIVVAQTLSFVPWACLTVAGALAASDEAQEDVAESLGAGRWQILTRVTLPRLRAALRAAAGSVFVLAAADVATPLLVGGGYDVLSTDVLRRTLAGDFTGAAALALLLIAPCFLIDPRPPLIGSSLRSRPPHRPTPTAVAAPLALVTATLAAALGVMAMLVVLGSLVAEWGRDWSPSLVHWRAALAGPSLEASLGLAVVVGAVTAILATAIAWAGGSRSRPHASLAERFALFAGAFPGIALGLGDRLAFGAVPVAVIVAVVTWRLPLALTSASVIVPRMRGPQDAAVIHGAGLVRRFRRIVAPALAPAAAIAFFEGFAGALLAVGVVLPLAPAAAWLAAPQALDAAAAGRAGGTGVACALVTALSVIVIAAVALRARAARPVGDVP